MSQNEKEEDKQVRARSREKRHGIVWQGMGGYGRIAEHGEEEIMAFCVILCHFGLEQCSVAGRASG